MTNPTSYTDEQVLELIELCSKGPTQAGVRHMGVSAMLRSLLADRQRLQAEVGALRRCAVQYLAWHDVKDPVAGLESDLRNPEMCGDAALPPSATPNETKEAKS